MSDVRLYMTRSAPPPSPIAPRNHTQVWRPKDIHLENLERAIPSRLNVMLSRPLRCPGMAVGEISPCLHWSEEQAHFTQL